MSHLRGANWQENLNNKFSINKGVGCMKKDCCFYKSFTLKGVRYFLYDSVYVYEEDCPEAHIGKIVEIYKTPADETGMKLVWFFRPNEIWNFLNDYKPSWKEIFLASGEGKGLSNISPLEAVIRKCNVLCASNDRRNPQASKQELSKADYIFMEHFFNPKKDQALVDAHNSEENFSSSLRFGLKKVVSSRVKVGSSGIKLSPVVKGAKKPAFNVDKLGCLLRPKSTSAECAAGERYKKNIGGLGGSTGESSSSSRLRLEKAVHDDNCGNRINPVVKVPVDQQEHFPSDKRKKNEALIRPLKPKARVKEWTGKSILCPRFELDKVVGRVVKFSSSGIRVSSVVKAAPNVDKQRRFSSYNTSLRPQTSDNDGAVRKISSSQFEKEAKVRRSEDIIQRSASDIPLKKRRLLRYEKESEYLDAPTAQHVLTRGAKTESLNVEVRRRPDSPWEKRLQRADGVGSLVCLENLDPSYTSSEVEDLVWHAFNERVDAKMLQHSTFSSPDNGKALVIFKSKDAADTAILELRRRCLMLAGGRYPILLR
ncbi:hypothetical protein Pint_30027 [Pistacia integerrima]|uniref:Uncharacterized protein n=1 Tax=Pistacia integerrima TaxID=434235 RepID=A0ACC0X119_9ROSI|nr:hypothetical protein Pint_30027 [Pistacia integerrima]